MTKTKSIILCALFAALTAIGAFIRVPLPIIPFTLQLPVVIFASILLKPPLAAVAQAVYLLVGLVGFPVFTKGGGLGYVFEPTFGYLLGLIPMSLVIGFIVKKCGGFKFSALFFAGIIGFLTDYVFGTAYMYLIMHFYLNSDITVWGAVISGAVIFLPKDLILTALVALFSKKTAPILKKSGLI